MSSLDLVLKFPNLKSQKFKFVRLESLKMCKLDMGPMLKKTGIEGCVFVHASGFIGGNKTKEGAFQMAINTIKAANLL